MVLRGKDVRVKPSESEQIVSAIRRCGIPMTYLLYPKEGHSIQRMENRGSYCAVVEALLAQHLHGLYERAGDNFTGSSIRLLVGHKLITDLCEAVGACVWNIHKARRRVSVELSRRRMS